MNKTIDEIVTETAERIWCVRSAIAGSASPNATTGKPYLIGEIKRAIEQTALANEPMISATEYFATVRELEERLRNLGSQLREK